MTSVAVPTGWSGYPAAATAATTRPRRTSHVKLIGLLVAGLLLAVGAVCAISALTTPSAGPVVCPPTCGHPPTGQPVQSLPRFTARDGSFSVGYYPSGSHLRATADTGSITMTVNHGAGAMELLGVRADSGSAAQTVTDLIAAHFPGARPSTCCPTRSSGTSRATARWTTTTRRARTAPTSTSG